MTAIRGVAVVGVGETGYYKRGTSPDGEHMLTLRAVLAACDEAGVDPRDLDGFASYGHDRNDSTKLAASLGVRDLKWTTMVWGGGGGGIAAAIAAAAAAVMS